MEEKKKDIVEQSLGLFFKLGVRNVSMDDIATALGMSKKTLYQHFSAKADLVDSIITYHLERLKETCQHIEQSGQNAIDKLLSIYKFNYQALASINPSTLFELKKYYPNSWKKLDEYKQNDIYAMVLQNTKEGISQGIYRADLNAEIIAKLYTHRMDMVLDGEAFPHTEYSFRDLMKELFVYHIRGIASNKGLEQLEKTELDFS